MSRSLILAALSGVVALSAANAQSESTLRYRAMPSFDVLLPAEAWRPGTDGIAIPHRGGSTFATAVEGLSVSIDTDGDGRIETTKKGSTAYVVLNGKRADGEEFAYAVRLRLSAAGGSYAYSASGAMVGALEGVPVQVIDQNNNGVFNEVGIDAMVIGQGRAAGFLSKVVSLKGELYELELAATGSKATTRPYSGPSGTIDVRGGLKLLGDLEAAVVTNPARTLSFEVAGSANGLRVPVGEYIFSAGFARKSGETAKLAAGKMKPMVVADGAKTMPQWGAPLMAEFGFRRTGEDLTVQPNVAFLGRAGEHWHTILPDAKSPKLMFYDKDSGRLLATKRFEGC
jgi:hypothetical protein